MKTTYPHETNMAGGWKLALWLIFKTPGDPVKKLRYVAEKKNTPLESAGCEPILSTSTPQPSQLHSGYFTINEPKQEFGLILLPNRTITFTPFALQPTSLEVEESFI